VGRGGPAQRSRQRADAARVGQRCPPGRPRRQARQRGARERRRLLARGRQVRNQERGRAQAHGLARRLLLFGTTAQS